MPVPFYDKEFIFKQPDGSQVKVRGWGNQYFAVFETLDGYTIVEDPLTHFYQYAKLSNDKNSLELTGAKVGVVDPGTLGLEKHIRISKTAARKTALAASTKMVSKARWQERREEAKSELKTLVSVSDLLPAPPSLKTIGDYVGLCILIQFPDVSGTVSQSEFDDFCNKKGYRNNGNNGSVYDYYESVSNGKVRYTITVTQYYTAKNNRSYYTDENIKFGQRARELITEALEELKTNGFDFSKLNADNKGYIYALNVSYAGQCDNNWRKGLWPHSSSLNSPFDIGNGRKFFDYQITDMGDYPMLQTFCHENGHMLCSFPDLYDYGYESTGAGNYCLMASGGADANPVHVCAYLKYKAGWADNVIPLTRGKHELTAGKNDFYIYLRNASEYFIIENRLRQNRDDSLPDSGLTIWHIDELGSNDNQEMTPEKHYECSLEQADGRNDLENNKNYGNAGDLFSESTNTRFDSFTRPNSRWWDGTISKLSLINIGASGPIMSFNSVFSLRSAAQKIDPTLSPISTKQLALKRFMLPPLSINKLIEVA